MRESQESASGENSSSDELICKITWSVSRILCKRGLS